MNARDDRDPDGLPPPLDPSLGGRPPEEIALEALDLEGPSPEVDDRITAMARQRLRGDRFRGRAVRNGRRFARRDVAQLLAAAAAVVAVAVAVSGIPRRDAPPEGTQAGERPSAPDPGPAAVTGVPARAAGIDGIRDAADRLRDEVVRIRETARLIPAERREEREEIARRVRECLAGLDELEREVERRERDIERRRRSRKETSP